MLAFCCAVGVAGIEEEAEEEVPPSAAFLSGCMNRQSSREQFTPYRQSLSVVSTLGAAVASLELLPEVAVVVTAFRNSRSFSLSNPQLTVSILGSRETFVY